MKSKKYVKVIDSTYQNYEEACLMIGNIWEVKNIDYNKNIMAVWDAMKFDFWSFNFSDVQEVTGVKFNGVDVCVGDEVSALPDRNKYKVIGYYKYDGRVKLLTNTEDATLTFYLHDISHHYPLYQPKVETIEIRNKTYNWSEVEKALQDIKEVK